MVRRINYEKRQYILGKHTISRRDQPHILSETRIKFPLRDPRRFVLHCDDSRLSDRDPPARKNSICVLL
jgi:hypothetical protein